MTNKQKKKIEKLEEKENKAMANLLKKEEALKKREEMLKKAQEQYDDAVLRYEEAKKEKRIALTAGLSDDELYELYLNSIEENNYKDKESETIYEDQKAKEDI